MAIKTNMHEDIAKVLLDQETIRKRVQELGKQISEDYDGKDLILVCILKGAVQFFSDLSRAIECHVDMDFMAISSYGNSSKTSGIVRLSKDMDYSITGRHVLIVEDIMDSGLTLNHLTTVLRAREPASLKIVCLLDKPERRECDISPDYVGFIIPNYFVVGYGLDCEGRYRNLPYVGVMKPEVYQG
jgi:hypoxanthine phosphoribosyltransferase